MLLGVLFAIGLAGCAAAPPATVLPGPAGGWPPNEELDRRSNDAAQRGDYVGACQGALMATVRDPLYRARYEDTMKILDLWEQEDCRERASRWRPGRG